MKHKISEDDNRNKPPDKSVEINTGITKDNKDNKDKNKKTVLNKADLEKIEKYEKYLTTFKVNNTSNESIVIDEVINENINKLVCKVNKIDIHTYHFFKYYCIYHFYKYDSLPKIDDGFIRSIMKTITSKNDTRGRSATKESQKDLVKLESFYNNYYKHTVIESDKVTREGLTNQFMYESEKIITCLTNHISSNFQSSLNRYINILIDMNEIKKHVREQDKIGNHTIGNKRATNSDINYSFKKLKNDIFKNKNKASPIYDKFKLIFKSKILKDFQVEKSLENHLKKDPLSLLILFIRISIEAEKIEIERQLPENKGKPIKAINCFPLRKSITPKYIKLDTRTVVETLLPEKERKLYRLSQSEKYDEIWSKFFKIGDKIFSKNGYKWNRNIMTNGVSSSVLFIREDKYNSDKQNKIKTMQKPFGYVEFKNIATLTPDQMKKIGFLSGKKYVGIDPGKGILIFCTDGKVTLVRKKSGKIHRKTNIFRYTNANRKFETKVKLNRKRLERMKAGKGDIETSILKDTIKYQERKLDKINNVKRPNDISIKKYEDDKKNLVKLIADNKNKLDKKVYLDKFNRSDFILGKTVKHYENMLSGISASSCLWSNVKKYIRTKNLVNYILFEFYERKIHRQNRWHQFINKQRADANMIQRFKDKFGPPEDVVIFMGNWSEGKPMKYQEPSKGKSIRRLFRRNGYEVLLVSEYNTSQKMYGTGAQLENFRKHEDKTKTRRQKIREKQKKKKQANKKQNNKKIGKDNDKNKTEIKQNISKKNKKQKTGTFIG